MRKCVICNKHIENNKYRVCCDSKKCKRIRKIITSRNWHIKNPEYNKIYMIYYRHEEKNRKNQI